MRKLLTPLVEYPKRLLQYVTPLLRRGAGGEATGMRVRFLHSITLLALLALFSGNPALAQRFSYVYLQGDKQTPIYVKLEGEMLPRYGQNYAIISRLAPGAINVEVLFQQNKFLPQKFVILVPEDGQRSLLLTQKDGGWALYDLQQKFYIPAGNIASEDRNNTPNRNVEKEPETPPDMAAETPSVPEIPTPKPVIRKNSGDPEFIPDLELSRGGNKPVKKAPAKKGDAPAPAPPVSTPTENVTAEGCSKPMSIDEFSTFYGQVLAQNGLEARLTFLMDSDVCPTPYQARIIARSLNGDAPRLRYLGRVVRRSPTPKTFLPLSNVFEDEDSAAAFRKMILQL